MKNKNLVTLICALAVQMLSGQAMAQVQIFSSNKEVSHKQNSAVWHKAKRNLDADIVINKNKTYQTIEGWGGCFNEKGWHALRYLTEAEREEIMSLLFADDGCAFGYCRMPIGASDYAMDYYSLNDTKGDYKMEHFSIERDRKYLLPYIKAALKVNPKIQVWGSPWTPPAWMKENRKYFAGSIKMTPKVLEAYALYFQKYVEAYRKEGVDIVAVHPQNEPLHLPAFPSCGWNGEQLNIFIRDYLGPRFKKHLPDCEIWLGTVNGNDKTDEFSEYVQTVLGDNKTSQYVTGAGFQWNGDAAVEQTIKAFPNKKIMQTETKCGWGSNDWKYAFQTYNQMVWYLERNSVYYSQWNMVLDETGMSSWGWKQNAMITVDTYNKTYRVNPQYTAVKHFTKFVKPGATRVETTTKEGVQALAFKNSDGQLVLVCSNQSDKEQQLTVQVGKRFFKINLSSGTIKTALMH